MSESGILIRDAVARDAVRLTRIAREAKAHRGAQVPDVAGGAGPRYHVPTYGFRRNHVMRDVPALPPDP